MFVNINILLYLCNELRNEFKNSLAKINKII